ncbi:MAG: hypothetical protein HQ567_22225 [Candidatus Nealsonbacteria bacterium]|nr:hypothetical protein [Candidatus Nealsonbacteria bacterium]
MTFAQWMLNRAPQQYLLTLRLLEQTHDKAAYNLLFDQQLSGLLRRVDTPAEHNQLVTMLNFDWMADIERALRMAGFGNETDELAHDIVVKLLVTPGGLFAGWRGQPMEARFRASVRNAIVSLIQKRANRRRLLPTVTMNPSVAYMGEPDDTLVQEFIDFLRRRYGDLAARLFQHKLEGGNTKDLIGDPNLGRPTRHAVKSAVKDIKAATRDYAARSGDPAFIGMVQKAMADEKETAGKRRAAVLNR